MSLGYVLTVASDVAGRSAQVLEALAPLVAAAGLATQLSAYPGGTPRYVTNASPYCANCHTSAGRNDNGRPVVSLKACS